MFSLVIPTYNEAENVGPCVEAVCRALEGREFEIVIADDDSPDRTGEVARNLGNPRVRVLRRTEDRGLGPAVIDGFAEARGDRLGVMDADLQHDEAILPQMIDALETHEFVIGSRAVEGGGYGDMSVPRRLASQAAAGLARALLGVPLADPMSGYFALRREVFERVRSRLDPRGYKIMLELFCLAQPGSYAEIGYRFRPRRAGRSKVSGAVARQYLGQIFELRRKLREP
ncbi:MAG: polyprenol monophosphomannose synthase [Planctomycetota bacterium]